MQTLKLHTESEKGSFYGNLVSKRVKWKKQARNFQQGGTQSLDRVWGIIELKALTSEDGVWIAVRYYISG